MLVVDILLPPLICQEMVMGRHELSDAAYALIAPLLPTNDGKTGRPWSPHRLVINGILWRLHTGAQWRDIPERYEP